MKITSVEWTGLRVPFRGRYVTAQESAVDRHTMLVVIADGEGTTGIGEAAPVGVGSLGDVQRLDQVLQAVCGRLLGMEPSRAMDLLLALLPDAGIGAAARFGVETALLDLRGKEADLPVAHLIGGEVGHPQVNAVIGMELLSDAVHAAKAAVSSGFGTLKLKVGRPQLEEDRIFVEVVRRAVGASVRLRIDANEAWDVEEAIVAINALEPFGLEYVEQPVAGIRALAQVREGVGVPIAADECLAIPADAAQALAANAADVFVVKAARVGGLVQAVKMIELAEAGSVGVVVTSSLETGVGIAASLHLAGVLPTDGLACGLATAGMLEHDMLRSSIRVADGRMQIPDRAGLGVELDMRAVARYAVGIEGRVGEG